MPVTRILCRLDTFDTGDVGLAITEIDLETANDWLELMDKAANVLRDSQEFCRIVRPQAPISLFMWPGVFRQPAKPQFISFFEALSSTDIGGVGVEIPGALPVPSLEYWRTYNEETSFHLDDGKPVFEWRIESGCYPGMFHVGGVTRSHLRRIRRKLECYCAGPDEKAQLFQEIENNDSDLAEQMVGDCNLLRRSLVPPEVLLSPEASGGRVQPLRAEDITGLLNDDNPKMREAAFRWLGESDTALE